jgi:hypothetical protein
LRHPIHLKRLIRCGVGFGLAKAKSFVTGRRGLLINGDETSLDLTSGHQRSEQPREQGEMVQISISPRVRERAEAAEISNAK